MGSVGDSEAYTVPFIINGKEVTGEKTFEVLNPSAAKAGHRCSSASVSDGEKAVAAAAEAFKVWRKKTPSERRTVLLKAADLIDERRKQFREWMLSETTDDSGWCDFDMNTCMEQIRDTAGRIGTIEGAIPQTQDSEKTALVLKEPFGVVFSMSPWNAPFILGARSIAIPLAAGNTVVFKATEMAPRIMHGLVSAFNDAGLPEGALNLIYSEPAAASEITTSIIANPHVQKINFTGSTAVGRIIGELAGKHLKQCVLELGGKAPAIVWKDADLENAATQCALGAFLNAGQICMSTERVIVHKDVAEEFKKKFADAVKNFFDSKEEGPLLIRKVGVEKNQKLVKDATEKGAKVLYGDADATQSNPSRMRPIVLGNITNDMDIYKTESFGPTVAVYEIESEEEALRIANDTEYGLSSAVFSEDLKFALKLARGIETGAVHINSMSVHDEAALPHGGVKASGYGRFNASRGLDEWVKTKIITFSN